MSEFVSLKPSGLSPSYDADLHGDRPVVTVEEKDARITVSYVFPGFMISDAEQDVEGDLLPFKEVGISGAGFVSESGLPLLPSFGRFVQIPRQCDFEIKVERGRPVRFEDVLVTPAQEDAYDGIEHEFEYDDEAYAEDVWYPEDLVVVTGPHEMNDYLALLVHVRPLQYNPGNRVLRGYSNIRVIISLTPANASNDDSPESVPGADPGGNLEGFGNFVVNPGRAIAERLPEAVLAPVAVATILPRGPEFLIIYDENLRKPAELLSDWKNKRGLLTEVVPIKKVGNTAAKIKAYIRSMRGAFLSRLRYVLLFGDVGNIVTEEVSGATTDHYFYTSKDAANSSDCVLPWVSGGRIPVGTEAEGYAVVRQIIRYEKDPPCDPEYYRRMTLAAFFQDDAPQDGRADRAYMKTMESIRAHLVTVGFDVERVYVSNNPNPALFKDGTVVPQEVKDAIVDAQSATDMLISETSEGQLIFGHRDHGGSSGWAHPSFEIDDLDTILSRYPSVFYSVNCLTGRFDANPSDCFAEALLEHDGGAPSLVAATELSGTWRNDSMMKGLFDAMWPGMIPTYPATTAGYAVKYNRLGDILNYTKAYLLVAHGVNSGVKEHFEIYHVIGDPTLQIWAHAPLSLTLTAKIVNNTLYINTSGCPAGSVLSVWHMGELLKRISPSSTNITIQLRDFRLLPTPVPVPAPIRRYITVCYYAPGYRFIERNVRF